MRRALQAGAALALCGCAALSGPPRKRVQFEPYPGAEVATVRNPHRYDGKPLCQRCHDHATGELLGHPIALCVACHTFGHKNHPVEVVQKAPRPADLPFMAGGKVACHTCHDPHDLGAHQAGLRDDFNKLCLRCHVRH